MPLQTGNSTTPATRTGAPGRPAFTASHLRACIESGHLRVEYQPKVPFEGAAQRYAVEALARIRHPELGVVPPDVFVAIAEKHGLIAELTDAVVRRAFADWRNWFEHGLTLNLAINVSPELLDRSDWVERFLERCREFDIATEYLVLEITESSSKSASDTAIEILTRLKQKGIMLSIDDFGTGFSSLATLYRLPFGELKIDKCFTMEIETSPAARALVESTVEMARRLGLQLTVEGVESESIFEQLKQMGCDYAQGYYISKSLPATELPDFLSQWQRSYGTAGAAGTVGSKLATIQALIERAFAPDAANQTVVLAPGATPDGSSVAADIAAIPALVLQGRRLQALAACHAAAGRLKPIPEETALRAQILELQRLLESELLVRGDLLLTGTDRDFRLIPRRSAVIGRRSDEMPVDIEIDCRWLSRGDRGLFLRCASEQWVLEDLGSRNGVMVDGQPLLPEKPLLLPPGRVNLEIGSPQGQRAPLVIQVTLLSKAQSGAAAITLSERETVAGESWPSRGRDLRTTWIVFSGFLHLGYGDSCAVPLSGNGDGTVATVLFQNGFWISPLKSPIALDGVNFHQPVPLPVGAVLSLGSNEFHIGTSSLADTRKEASAVDGPSERRHAGGRS